MVEKISTGEALDRLGEFKQKNTLGIEEMIQSLIEQDPFEGKSFYVFAHKRTIEMDERFQMFMDNGCKDPFDQIPSAKMLWQARLTKPFAQENSMLFKVNPKFPDQVKVIWILPEKEKFHLYDKGKFFEDQITAESVHDFLHNREELEAPETDDLSDIEIRRIYASKRFNSFNSKIGNVFRQTFKEIN